MSLFNDTLGVDPDVRRRLFWLVCIWFRLTLAITAWAVIEQYGDTARYAVGGGSIAIGLSFAYKAFRRHHKNSGEHVIEYEPGLWWYRSFHAFIWVAAGIAAFALHYDNETVGIAVTLILVADVLVGMCTAYFDEPFISGDDDWLFEGTWEWCAASDSSNAMFTWWTIVHVVLASGIGVAAYYASPDELWPGCIGGTLIVFLWEAFENSCTNVSGRILSLPAQAKARVCCGNPPESRKKVPDSAFNMFGDLIVGIACVWSAAYITRAAQ